MGFKGFRSKIGKVQDALKVLVNASYKSPATNTQTSNSSSSSNDEHPIPPQLRVKQALGSTTGQVDVNAFARGTLATPSPVKKSLLRRRLSKAVPFLKQGNKGHLSGKQALEQIHARTSPFITSPKISKIPSNLRVLRQQPVEIAGEVFSQTESASGSASTESFAVEAPGDLETENIPESNRASPFSIEQQEHEDLLSTVEEPIVWVSNAAYAVLGAGAASDIFSGQNKRHQGNRAPTLGFDVSAEHTENRISINSSQSSERTSSSGEVERCSTPLTPTEVGNSCAKSQDQVPLDSVFEEQNTHLQCSQTGSGSPCPPTSLQTAVGRSMFDSTPVADSYNHQLHFHVHASIAPADQATPLDSQAEELQRLQDSLDYRDNLNQGLRLQLLDRENEVAKLQKQLQTLQKERDMFEAEQDASSEQLQTTRQQLATKDRELIKANTSAVAALHELQVARNSIGVGTEELIAERDRARQEAQAQFHRTQHFYTMANTATAERDNMAQQVAYLEAMANMSSQQHNAEVQELRERLEQTRDAIEGLEQQMSHVVGLKNKAENRVQELEVRVQSLLQDVTAKWVENPVEEAEEINSNQLKPNELRDLRQAFEISQARLAAAAEVNQELHEAAEHSEKEHAELRESNDLLKDKAARLSSIFEIWMTKLDNWMQTIPGIVKMQDRVEEVPGLKVLLEESVFHEQSVGRELKAKADLVSELEATALKLKREHNNEIEALNQRANELQEENIRQDAQNFQLTDQLHSSQQELERLKHELSDREHEAQQWKAQCLEQAFGDTAQLINKQHERQLKQYSDVHDALMHRCEQFHEVKYRAESELRTFRWLLAEELAGVAELGTERDWYRAQVEALRERFQHELLVEPLEIPYQPAYSQLSPEDREAIIAGQDYVIDQLTGVLPVRSGVKPRNIEVVDLWARFVAWVLPKEEGNTEGEGKQKADPVAEVTPMAPLPLPKRHQASHGAVQSEGLEGQDGSSWITEDGSEAGPSDGEPADCMVSIRGSSILF